MNQITEQIQSSRLSTLRLSTLVRQAIGKYNKMEGVLSDGENKRCVVGAIFSELGWDGKGSPKEELYNILRDTLQTSAMWMDMVNRNNSTTENNWSEIADWLEDEGF